MISDIFSIICIIRYSIDTYIGESKKHYRCIIPKLPRATTGVLLKDKNGDLELKEVHKDESHIHLTDANGYQIVYNNGGTGDSGGPILIKRYVNDKEYILQYEMKKNTKNEYENEGHMKEKRNIIVAVTTGGTGINAMDTKIKDQGSRCIHHGAKVSEDIIKWIKKLDSGDYSSDKKGKKIKIFGKTHTFPLIIKINIILR